MIFCCPVGPYYTKPLRLLVADGYVRAFKGGVADAKTAGNYAATMYHAKKAGEQGFDQIIWMDGNEFKYIQESGTMNLFFVLGDTIVTPPLDGTILPGITRDTLITYMRSIGYKVEERMISIDEVAQAAADGTFRDCFGTGTAAVVASVAEISWKGKILTLPPVAEREISNRFKQDIQLMRTGQLAAPADWVASVQLPDAVG